MGIFPNFRGGNNKYLKSNIEEIQYEILKYPIRVSVCFFYTLTLTHIMSQTSERFIPANFSFGCSRCHFHVLFSPCALLGKNDVKLSTFHPAASKTREHLNCNFH